MDFIKPYNNDPSVGHLSTPITTSAVTNIILSNLPAYRPNMSPILRGLEVGMAHGYLLLGPFNTLGPLRDSKFSLMVAVLSTIGLVTILTLCLVIYGKVTFKPEDEKSRWHELFNTRPWENFTSGFLIGAYGGVGFGYVILLTLQSGGNS